MTCLLALGYAVKALSISVLAGCLSGLNEQPFRSQLFTRVWQRCCSIIAQIVRTLTTGHDMGEAFASSQTSSRRASERAMGNRLRIGSLCSLLFGALWCPMPAAALDFGPFVLSGFIKNEIVRKGRQCPSCQVETGEGKQRVWADALVSGAPYETRTVQTVLFQPWLGANFDLGQGVRLSGMLSQRRRDGDNDIPGFLYERNVAVSHERFGRLAYGAMPTRAWAVADYPYGSNVGQAEPWASSGAGYGLLTRALRYTSRPLDVAEGDLVLEVTLDRGETDFRINKPRFAEFYAQYVKGDLVVDAIVQDTRNGTPSAWSHGPFTGLTPFAADDALLASSSQSIVLLMARYQIDARWEVSGGFRHNRWSGADAVQTGTDPVTGSPLWNMMFNVDWGGVRAGKANPGYAARSIDLMTGARYRAGPWTWSAGLTYLGKATTSNPSDRGQHNTALIGSLGLNHDFGNGLQAYALAGAVRYGRLGLSPMSMPGNDSFSGVDSRAHRSGHSVGLGVVYTF